MNFWYHLCWWLCRIGLFFWHPVFHVTGREQIPAGSCIFCANHSGMADPIWILLALPEKKNDPHHGQAGAAARAVYRLGHGKIPRDLRQPWRA